MEFSTFHRYNQLVRRGLAKPLECPQCHLDYAVRLGKDDEPVLWCFGCQARVTPGLRMYEQIRAVVKEHFA